MGRTRSGKLGVVCIALTALLCAPTISSAGTYAQLDSLATNMAGKPVSVECVPRNDYWEGMTVLTSADMGKTWENDGTVYMIGEDCGALMNVFRARAGSRKALTWVRTFNGTQIVGSSIDTLLHESTHVRLLEPNEGIVECTAYRNLWPWVRRIIGSPHWKLAQNVYRAGKTAHFALPHDYTEVC